MLLDVAREESNREAQTRLRLLSLGPGRVCGLPAFSEFDGKFGRREAPNDQGLDSLLYLAMALAMLASRSPKKRSTMHRAEIDSIYESAHIGLCVIGTDYRYLRINDRLAEINGFPVDAHIGRTVREIIPAVADQAEEIIDSIVRTGQPRLDVEFVGETAVDPGRKRYWLEQWSPLKDESGKVTAN
jgi:PAS domain-containing protein